MRYAIIAAGEGSRLAEEGIEVPKPLVEVGGERLIDRLIRIFMANGATEIVVICNRLTTLVSDHLRQMQLSSPFHSLQGEVAGTPGGAVPLRFVQKTTPSSMHSMFELSPMLQGEPFVLTTVDTIFREEEFSQYVAELQRIIATGEADGLMGVTDYIDDEKPLYVRTAVETSPLTSHPSPLTSHPSTLSITAFLDRDDAPKYISGGIYGLTPRSLDTLRACIARGESRMRNFQRALLADGLHLRAWPFSKVLDIDHASDIVKAERFLSSRAI